MGQEAQPSIGYGPTNPQSNLGGGSEIYLRQLPQLIQSYLSSPSFKQGGAAIKPMPLTTGAGGNGASAVEGVGNPAQSVGGDSTNELVNKLIQDRKIQGISGVI